MPNPQSPEVRRSGTTDLDPDSIGPALEARRSPGSSGPTGPVPEDNQPGHHPAHDQDKPPLDDFAERFGARRPDDADQAEGDHPDTDQPEADQAEAEGVTVHDPDALVARSTARAERIADEALRPDATTGPTPAEPGAGELASQGLSIATSACRWGLAVLRYGARSATGWVPGRR
ncbi:MAG TPA: hypothetical protein VK866_05235 [Acidimicrobiales bacterium]|nr:hypothetical protein [Acidimicrobiales bacterium]